MAHDATVGGHYTMCDASRRRRIRCCWSKGGLERRRVKRKGVAAGGARVVGGGEITAWDATETRRYPTANWFRSGWGWASAASYGTPSPPGRWAPSTGRPCARARPPNGRTGRAPARSPRRRRTTRWCTDAAAPRPPICVVRGRWPACATAGRGLDSLRRKATV